MKKGLVASVLAGAVLVACTEGHRGISSLTSISADSDELDDSAAIEEEVEMVPREADELFDDFFFNYASNRRWQQERTMFPLSVVDGAKTTKIAQRQWKQEPFFMNQDYYTLIFDSQLQMESVLDTAVIDATVERINLDEGRVQQFLFSRRSGRWMLHEIRWQPLPHNPNAQFLSFYQRFVADSLFQHESLADQIEFSGPDPDDDFSVLEGVITPDFWDAFKPELPEHLLYNIVYGHQNPAATQKIFLLRGIANGLEMEITFQLKHGRWKLTRLMM
jgi:hypothetical protein